MISKRPAFSIEAIRGHVLEHYGLEGSLEPMPGERGQNTKLDAGERGCFVVKIDNKMDDREVLEFQNAALDYLASHWSAGIVQEVVKTSAGDSICTITDTTDEEYHLRVLSYMPGEPISGVFPRSARLLDNLGFTLGELDVILANFSHPAMERFMPWDLRTGQWISTHTHCIPDSARRGIVERVLLQFKARTVPLLADIPISVIHSDGNDNNVLVEAEPDGEMSVTGLLDFGDMRRTNTINEAAIACAYMILRTDEPLEVAASVLDGYHRARPVSETVLRALFPLILLRLCISVVMSAMAAVRDPDNKYAQISDEMAWEALEYISDIDWSAAENHFRTTCGFSNNPALSSSQLEKESDRLRRHREKTIGPSLSLAYDAPLVITAGRGPYLYDPAGRAYLDCVNNVCHVGHCHPKVVTVLSNQAAILNTNTRYLHPYLVEYAERLTATLPKPLEVCYFVNSGSEANELALRLAFAYTQRHEVVVLEDAYHGNTTTLVDISPYKSEGPGGKGLAPWVHKVAKPDPYRGHHRGMGKEAGKAYAEYVRECCEGLAAKERPPALFICESLPGVGGQIIFPKGYLQEAFRHIRATGGVCAVDEVQVGFGRVGSHMWAFETQGVVPDIVTLGKPMGNGHPIGAVITTREIAASFDNGMEFFSTFGGNPVSCAVGLAVLEVIEEEELRQGALETGDYLKKGFEALAERHTLIGDVRGLGLFIGVELVTDREKLTPAAKEAHQLIEMVKEDGILLSVEGPCYNVLKIKPPLQFDKTDADLLLGAVDRALGQLAS